jgi:CRP/FNR family cyclic AMP-dependent transcriptional regulator
MPPLDNKLWYIRNIDLLAHLSDAELASLGEMVTQVEFARGQEVCVSGAGTQIAYVIREGAVRLVLHTAAGKRLTVAILKAGEMFGNTGLVAADEPGESAEAMTGCVLYAVPSEQLRALALRNADFALEVTKIVDDHRRQIVNRVQDVLFLTVQERVSRLLLRLADEFPGTATSGRRFVNIRLTHAEIADLIGSNREAVSACLVRLRKAKLVASVKGFLVLGDEAGLKREADRSVVAA